MGVSRRCRAGWVVHRVAKIRHRTRQSLKACLVKIRVPMLCHLCPDGINFLPMPPILMGRGGHLMCTTRLSNCFNAMDLKDVSYFNMLVAFARLAAARSAL